jgi:hypothetical protein
MLSIYWGPLRRRGHRGSGVFAPPPSCRPFSAWTRLHLFLHVYSPFSKLHIYRWSLHQGKHAAMCAPRTMRQRAAIHSLSAIIPPQSAKSGLSHSFEFRFLTPFRSRPSPIPHPSKSRRAFYISAWVLPWRYDEMAEQERLAAWILASPFGGCTSPCLHPLACKGSGGVEIWPRS